MTARQINLSLWTTAVLLIAAAGAAVVAGIVWPLAQLDTSPPATQMASKRESATDSLDQYAVLWSRRLRDLSGKTGAPAVASAPADQGATLALAGTVGHTIALLRLPDGTIHVRAVGESLNGMQVISVEPSKVTLRGNGQDMTLVKPKSSLLADRIR
jgi:hypothetical protein